jgi:hypothetical protein
MMARFTPPILHQDPAGDLVVPEIAECLNIGYVEFTCRM